VPEEGLTTTLLLTETKNNILVLGIGNLLLNDEGIGIRVVRDLEESGGLPGADILDGGTGGLHLLGILQSYKTVILVDASLDQHPPGHIRILHPKFSHEFPKQLSAHEIGLKDLIDAAGLLGNLPEIHLIAVSVSEFQELGMDLTTEVEGSVPEVIRMVKQLVSEIS
jgi:hydrogenase maturation protease